MFSPILSLLAISFMAGITIGITALLVQRDFFLPGIFFQSSLKLRKFLAASWVLAVTGTTLLVLMGACWFVFGGVSRVTGWIEEGFSGLGLPLRSPMGLWTHMGWLARSISVILFIESIWSLAVMIDRYLYFSAARKQSREFAPKVAGALKNSKLEEAIKIADRNKKSHLAEVVIAGLREFRVSGGMASEETIESSQRALERAEAIVHAKLKRGLSVLATIGATAPFVGLFGTVIGLLNAFQQIAAIKKGSGFRAIAGGISEALVTTAFGLMVAIPVVLAFNYFTGRVEAFDVEMKDSADDLIGTLKTLGQSGRQKA